MKESDFQKKLKDQIRELFPGSIVTKNDPTDIQGFPDLTIYWKNKYAMLECKKSKNAKKQPNQSYWIERLNDMSFSAFIYPENMKEVLDELKKFFMA